MYCDYWNLNRLPFESDGDLDFFVAVPEAEAALLKLQYVHESNKAGGVLVGESGSGKSYLVRRFASDVRQEDGDDVRPIVRVSYPRLKPEELVAQLAVRLGADSATTDSASVGLDRLVDAFAEQVHAAGSVDRSPVLILDDAHLIDDPNVWRTIRMLMNIREEDGGQFSLVVLGQNELLGRLQEHPDLHGRLSVQAKLPALSESSLRVYLERRMEQAGGTSPFRRDAVADLHQMSRGLPRRVNELADLALLVGVADQRTTIAAADIRTAESEMHCVSAT